MWCKYCSHLIQLLFGDRLWYIYYHEIFLHFTDKTIQVTNSNQQKFIPIELLHAQ